MAPIGGRRQKGKGIKDWISKAVGWARKAGDAVKSVGITPSSLIGRIPNPAAQLISKGLKSQGYGRKRKTGGARKGVRKSMGGGRSTGTRVTQAISM